MKIAFLILFAVTLFAAGIYFGGDRTKWVETDAAVTEAIVREDLNHRNRNHGVFTPFYIDGQVEYSSPKGKHTYKMGNMLFGFSDRKSADEAAQKLLHSKKRIKYNPDKPSEWMSI
jgi:hypothetical protein